MTRNIQLIGHNNPNLKESPFSIRANPDVIGFEKEKKLLVQYIKNGDVCFLTGPTGIGKSSLLLWLKNNLNSYNVFYIDAANIEKSFTIKEFLKNSRRGFDNFRDYPRNAIILLDESQDCDCELQKALKLHWDHGHIKSIVITQIDQSIKNFSISFKDRIGNRIIRLGKLKKSDALQLINSRLRNKKFFDAKVVEKIIEIANYVPRKILELCELIYINNSDKKESKLVDVKKILAKKTKLRNLKPDTPNKNQINTNLQKSNEIRKIPCRLTLLQKKIINGLNREKTIEEISKDLTQPLEEIKVQLDNLQNLGIIVAQNQKIYSIT